MNRENPYESPRDDAPNDAASEKDPAYLMAHEAEHALTTVATFGTSISAETARLALLQAGFQAFVADSLANTSFSILGGNAVGWVKLQTAARDATAARAFLESQPGLLWESGHDVPTQPDDACLSCGATIPEDQSACPACGWTFDVASEDEETGNEDEEGDEHYM